MTLPNEITASDLSDDTDVARSIWDAVLDGKVELVSKHDGKTIIRVNELSSNVRHWLAGKRNALAHIHSADLEIIVRPIEATRAN